MQTNPNIENKNIVEKWEWDDGWDKSNSVKRLYRRLRRKRFNRGKYANTDNRATE